MNRMKCVALVPILVAAAGASDADVRRHVEYLASPELAGRLTGTDGERRAADYLVAELEAIGARPAPGASGLRMPFEFTSGSRDMGSWFEIEGKGGHRFNGDSRVQALSFSDDGDVSGPVVFAGYGLVVPDGQEIGYDSYIGLDVTDKIVLVLRYFPEDADAQVRAALTPYSGLRYKALQARERGAKALVVLTGPRSLNPGKTVPMTFDAAVAGSGIVATSIDGRVGAALFRRAGKSAEVVQRELDSGNPHVAGFEIPDVTIRVHVDVEREKRTGQNVVGYLAPRAADGSPVAPDGYVLVGAHYDHLGRGRHANSLAKRDEENETHFGADDNASGVAAVLAAGADLATAGLRRGVLLAFWSGEELGQLGSTAFVNNPPVDLGDIVAYVNLDMVGRMVDNRLNLQGVGSSPAWPKLVERTNVPIGFDAHTQDDPYLPTDSTVLYRAEVPTLNLFTGAHEDYHRPSDVPGKIAYDDLQRVARFAARLVVNLDGLDSRPEWVEVERSPSRSGDRDTVRAYTGTIPDYATEVEGLRLSGVIGGGPADKAGLVEGDVIVEFGGRKIANVYDYTYALDAVKIDETIRVVIVRDGKRLEVEITPTSRP